jgi:hypothetical protein
LQGDGTSKKDGPELITRREALSAAAGVGAGYVFGSAGRAAAIEQSQSGAKVCVLTPEAVEGPFYFDPKLVRSDITDLAEEARELNDKVDVVALAEPA